MSFNAGELVATIRMGLQQFEADKAIAVKKFSDVGAAADRAGVKAEAVGTAAASGAKRTAAAADAEAAAIAKGGTAAEAAASRKVAGEAATKRAAGEAEAAFNRQNRAITQLGLGVTAFGAVSVLGFALAARAQVQFGSRMAQLQSLSHANAAQMSLESEAALTLGQSYGLTANDVADAEIELQKAGQGVTEQLNGGLKGALTLAAAGQLGVADATSIAVTALTQFHQSADQTGHVADILAAGSDKALGSVKDLGDGLKQGGLVAAQMGLSVDDTVGTLSAFANAGLIGSDAGTSFKTMLLSLQSPSSQAKKYLDQYNITAYDSHGAFVGITNLAGQLHDKLGGLSQAQRDAALSTIFGTDAIRSANVLYNEGSKGISGWISDVNDSGFAARQAAGKMNSLEGDSKKLAAAWQTDLIRAGQGVNPMMRGIVQATTAVVTAFGKIDPATQGVLISAGAVIGVIALVGGAFLLAIPKVAEFTAAVDVLSAKNIPVLSASLRRGATTIGSFRSAAGSAASFLGGPWGIALAVASAALLAYDQAVDASKASTSSLTAVASKGAGSIDDLLRTAARGQNTAQALNKFLDFDASDTEKGVLKDFSKTLDHIASYAGNPIGSFFLATTQDAAESQTLKQVDTALTSLSSTSGPKAAQMFVALASKTDGSTRQLQTLVSLMPSYSGELETAAIKAGKLTGKETDAQRSKILLAEAHRLAAGAAKSDGDAEATTAEQLSTVSGSAADAAKQVKGLSDALQGLGSSQLDENAAERDFQQAVSDASTAVSKNKHTLDLHTQAGRDNQAALDGIASKTDAVASAMVANGRSQKDVTKAVQDGRDAYVKAATALTGSAKKANDMADALHLIPADVKTLYQISGLDAAAARIKAIRDGMNNLRGQTADIYVNLVTHGVDTGRAAQVAKNAGLSDPVTKAAGGEVDGPGPKGVDSVVALLAPGEHVLTAGDVDAMGGQQHVLAFRRGLHRDGMPAYAAGGGVLGGPPRVAAPVALRPVVLPDTGAIQAQKDAQARYERDAARAQAQVIAQKKQLDAAQRASKAAQAEADRRKKLIDQASERADKARDAAANLETGGKTKAARAASAADKKAAERTARSLQNDVDAARKASKTADAEATKAGKTVTALGKKVDASRDVRDKATSKAEDAAGKVEQLRNDRTDLARSLSRGELTDPANPFSASDQALAASRDSNYTAAERATLAKVATTSNTALIKLQKQATDAAAAVDSTGKALDDANKVLDDASAGYDKQTSALQSLRDASAQLVSSIAGSVRSFFSLDKAVTAESSKTSAVTHNAGTAAAWDEQVTSTTAASVTVQSIRATVDQSASSIESFAGQLEQLRRMGYSTDVVTDVANEGVEKGAQIAAALITGTGDDVQAVNAGYNRISSGSTAAGTTVAGMTYGQQIADQQHQVDLAQQQVDAAKHGVDLAQAQLDQAKASVVAINSQIVSTEKSVVTALQTALATRKADGGIVTRYAAGGMRDPQIAAAGANILWAEPETGGEAYIPFAVSKRPRALAIAQEVARRFGMVMVPGQATAYANGGLAGASQPAQAGAGGGDTYDLRGGTWLGTPEQVIAAFRADAAATKARANTSRNIGRVQP